MRKAVPLLALVFTSAPALFAGRAIAQAPALPGATTAPAGPPAGSPSANPVVVPPPPDVKDPMLAPVPLPARVLGSWREAIALLRSRSTDLKTSVDQVLEAEAQTRIALAQYLPTLV